MNRLKIIILFGLLLSLNTIWAQFGNQGFGNGGMAGGFGGNNNMGQMEQQRQEPNRPTEISAEVTAKKVVENLNKKLNFDELQSIAIEGILIKMIKAQGVIIKKVNSDNEKEEDIKALSENTDRKIMELLNTKQKEIYKAIIEQK